MDESLQPPLLPWTCIWLSLKIRSLVKYTQVTFPNFKPLHCIFLCSFLTSGNMDDFLSFLSLTSLCAWICIWFDSPPAVRKDGRKQVDKKKSNPVPLLWTTLSLHMIGNVGDSLLLSSILSCWKDAWLAITESGQEKIREGKKSLSLLPLYIFPDLPCYIFIDRHIVFFECVCLWPAQKEKTAWGNHSN